MDDISNELGVCRRFYTAEEVAAIFGISPKTAYKLRKDGILIGRPIGRSVRFYKDLIDEMASSKALHPSLRRKRTHTEGSN